MKVYEASIQYSLVSDGKSQPLDAPEKVHLYMRDAFEKNPLQESVWVICLNRKNHPLARALVTLGSATNSIVNPPEIFRIAILAGATSVILVHNHPSGDPAPSAADLKVTRTIREAGQFMNIELLDHVVCGDEISDPNGKGYYSFNEAGLC